MKILLMVCVRGVFLVRIIKFLSSARGLSSVVALSLLTFLCFKNMCSWGACLITAQAQGPELPPPAPAFEVVVNSSAEGQAGPPRACWPVQSKFSEDERTTLKKTLMMISGLNSHTLC